MHRSWHLLNSCWRSRMRLPLAISRGNSVSTFPFSRLLNTSVTQFGQPDTETVDRTLLRLDSEIRKVGRINRHEIQEILDDIKAMRKATSSQSLMILRCCGELVPGEAPENRTKLVKEVWATMEKLNVPTDISHYNALLKVYLENNHKFDPQGFLNELKSKGIEPNRVTYQRLITRYCQDGNLDGASNILQIMKDNRLPINEYVFNSLLMGHANCNDMESAEGIIAVMKQAGLEPNDDTYLALINGYARNGDIVNVHRVVNECRAKDIFLIDRDFLNVIFTLAANNHDERAGEIFPYLQKHSGFNQEAINVILKLVTNDKIDIAFKILQQMSVPSRRDEPAPVGVFFIKQLILTNKPSEVIVKYCKTLESLGMNKYALVKACEIALENQKFEIAPELLEALKESGFPIRQHYFWPFFASGRSEKDIYDGLKHMMYLEAPPNQETLREYVIPNLLSNVERSTGIEATLENLSAYTNIPIMLIFPSALLHLVQKRELRTAAKFAVRYRLKTLSQNLRRALVESFIETQDAKNTARVLGSVGGGEDDACRESTGAFLVELVESRNGADLLPALLDELIAVGIGITNTSAELVQNSIGNGMTPEMTQKIHQLLSSDLVRKVETYNDIKKEVVPMTRSTEELEELLENAKLRQRPTNGLMKTLLMKYFSERNEVKVEKLRQEMEETGFVFGTFLTRSLLEFYCDVNNFEKGKETYELLTKNDVDQALNDGRIVKYALLLLRHKDFEGAERIITTHPRVEEQDKTSTFWLNGLVQKLLNGFAEECGPEKAKSILDVCVQRQIVPRGNYLLGSVVKGYLDQDDVESALNEFESCVKEYKMTPCKSELFIRLIKAEDAERLQRVLDLSTNVHGEVNSLYDLVFAFLECGKVRQAKKILDTPGLRARNEKLENISQKYVEENRIEELENLVQVTKDVFDVDRNALYMHLLKAYCKSNDPDKALSVWTSLQEENVQASPELLTYLADFLRENKKEVPFVVPVLIPANEKKERNVQPTNTPRVDQSIRAKIRAGKLDEALSVKDSILCNKTREITITEWTDLTEALLNSNRLGECARVVNEAITDEKYPAVRVLRRFVDQLSKAKEVETLNSLCHKLPSKVQNSITLESRRYNAMVNAGRGLELFEAHKNSIEGGKNTLLKGQPFYGSSALTKVLAKNENLIPEALDLAQLEVKNGGDSMYQTLWAYYFSRKDFSKAQEIWETHLRHDKVSFGAILGEARENADESLAEALYEFANKFGFKVAKKASIINCILDIKKSQDVSVAVELLKKYLQDVEISDLRYPLLKSLKDAALSKGIEFPYKLQRNNAKRKEDSSSGSDSD